MANIEDLLANFGKDGYVSPEDLKTVADVVQILVDRVSSLEAQVQALSK
jgi:hypothetical protein